MCRPGPDGSIVIDKGLAADGDPLADGGGGFECDNIDDCWDQCEVHCFCTKRRYGYCCCNVNEGELACETCGGGGGGGCGGGGGGQIGLSCTGTQRGSHGSCRAYTGELDPDSLRFDWALGRGRLAVGSSYSATGRRGMTWGGRATETRTITLEISREGGLDHGQRVWRGSATVRVSARNWRLQTQHKSPTNSATVNRWGFYGIWLPKRSDLYVREGSGPWAGSYYLSGSPEVRAEGMWIHSDLASGGPPYLIPASDTICGLSNVLRGVHALNRRGHEDCNRGTALSNFRSDVVAHEYEHQNSLNDCIRVMNRRWMGHVEEATGDRDHVDRVLRETWGGVVVADLLDAKETAQGSISADIWEHRKLGRWTEGARTAGHSGMYGC